MLYKCKYFKIDELVSPSYLQWDVDTLWKRLPIDLLEMLDAIRETFKKPITINDVKNNQFQRGFVHPNDNLLKRSPLSAHMLGCGFDLLISGWTTEMYDAFRQDIVNYKSSNYLIKLNSVCQRSDYIKLLELIKNYGFSFEDKKEDKPISWLHIQYFTNFDKILFDA